MKNLIWGLFAFATLAHAQGTVTDIDGNTYYYLTYGTQQWTVENAAMETYRDGTPIPQVTDATQWSSLTKGAWCYYDNDPTKGKLYNWYAVAGIHDNDPNTPNKEFAPLGWHVPTHTEWTTLEEHLIANGYNYDGTTTGNKIAKSLSSTSGWDSSTNEGTPGNNQNENNSSGFNSHPQGSREENGILRNEGKFSVFWSSTMVDSNISHMRYLDANNVILGNISENKYYGYSVRFVQNSNTCSEASINASDTEVCAGESVDLNVVGDVNSTYLWSTGESNFSGQGTLIDEYSLIANTVSQNTFSTIPGNIYRLEVSGTISLGGGAGNQRDVAYYIQSGSDGTIEGTPFDSACNLRIWTSLFCDTPGLRPSPDIYDASTHTYNYPFTANSSTLDVGFWDSPLGDNGSNVVTFKLYELSNSVSTITVTPTETTEYWVDVTTNGVTCREYITIDVTSPAAPTGNPVQGGCSDFTVGSNNNAFSGENLQWYATPSGGNALPESHPLVDGAYYYISQTVDGCESSDRFEFLYLAPEPTITIESPTICEGDSTTVSVSSSPSLGTATFLWNTGETSESITLSPTESTTFWVDQIYNSGGPENIQTICRYFFGITVDNAPEVPISGGDITECETVAAQTLTAIASANTGESITWYDAATGGNVVTSPSLSTAGTETYYAEAINDTSGCASLTRTAVTLTITSVAAPTGDAVQSFCDNITVSDLSASGSNIQWYDAAIGGNLLDPSSALSDGQFLYASQTENSCESITRLEVSVEIDIIPDPILITTELEFCLSRETTLADLEVLFDDLFFALEWYDSFSGGNMLPMDTLLEDGVSYYATLYDAVSGCESLMRLEVVPTVIPCEVVIYNAISLNDNGINDYMVIENAEYFPDNILEIYNRDGHLLYSQTQYSIGDNLFRGVANVSGIYASPLSGDGPRLPTGSYLYVFKYFNPYEQQQFTLKGFLTINSN